MELLERVARHYAEAKTYRIEAVEESESDAESGLSRQWNKNLYIAAEAPGGRRYFESQAQLGHAVEISDGKSLWKYHPGEHRYTVSAVPSPDVHSEGAAPKETHFVPRVEYGLMAARILKQKLERIAQPYRSAALLPDETLNVGGQQVRCRVVHLLPPDLKRASSSFQEMTYWIDARREVVVRSVERERVRPTGGGDMVLLLRTATDYTKTVIGGELAEVQFVFAPGPDVRRIDEFPDQRDSMAGVSLVGDPAPALQFKGADGKVTTLVSLRGHTVILDFWATTCGPCVLEMPRLSELYAKGKEKGLLLISIDQDEDAAKGDALFATKGYAWPNYHDTDGAIAAAMGEGALPRLVLIDAQGVIQYDGFDEDRMLMHLKKLSPEFQSLAP